MKTRWEIQLSAEYSKTNAVLVDTKDFHQLCYITAIWSKLLVLGKVFHKNYWNYLLLSPQAGVISSVTHENKIQNTKHDGQPGLGPPAPPGTPWPATSRALWSTKWMWFNENPAEYLKWEQGSHRKWKKVTDTFLTGVKFQEKAVVTCEKLILARLS